MPLVIAKGIDSAFAPRPTPQQIKERGYVASGRYYGGSPSKRITRAEADDLHGVGVIPFTVMEGGTTMAFAPAAAAAVSGEALREAAGAGQPAGTCIFFACDSDPTGHEATVTDFFTRTAAIVRPAGFLVGFYGQGELGSKLKAAGVVDHLWATVAWSHGFVPANADLLQLVAKDPGFATDHDVNLIYTVDFGGWSTLGASPTPTPHPSPAPVTGGVMPAAPLVVTDPLGRGYWHVLPDGEIHPFGVPVWGDLTGVALAAPIVDADVMPAGDGLVLLGRDGGVFAFGSAQPHGNSSALGAVCTAIRLTSSGAGYFVSAQDGGVFAYGDAHFLGHA